MQTFEEIGDCLKGHIPEILEDLQSCCEGEPWCSLSPQERLNNLAEVTRALIDVALGKHSDAQAFVSEVRSAADHGEHRHNAGFAEDALFAELTLLRHALWRCLWQHAPKRQAREASILLDNASLLALTASLRGYHRPRFESRGEWPQVIDELVTRWHVAPNHLHA